MSYKNLDETGSNLYNALRTFEDPIGIKYEFFLDWCNKFETKLKWDIFELEKKDYIGEIQLDVRKLSDSPNIDLYCEFFWHGLDEVNFRVRLKESNDGKRVDIIFYNRPDYFNEYWTKASVANKTSEIESRLRSMLTMCWMIAYKDKIESVTYENITFRLYHGHELEFDLGKFGELYVLLASGNESYEFESYREAIEFMNEYKQDYIAGMLDGMDEFNEEDEMYNEEDEMY